MTNKSIWITWEDHRRSRELATALNATYIPLLQSGNRFIRYVVLSLKTLRVLIKTKPNLIYCQNPSIILNTLLCLLRPVFRFKLVADRHSNFKFSTIQSKSLKWMLFHLLSKFTLKNSDLTIVTNDYLKKYIDEQGGNGVVLQDKLPTLKHLNKMPLKGQINFVFISTFSSDEPIKEVIAAAGMMLPSHHLYVTGGYKKYHGIANILENLPKNVTLTGFLPEDEYQSLLYSADILIVITDQEYTLTCGAYEAVSLEKPMILGNTQTIKDYFSKGAIYTAFEEREIAASMNQAVERLPGKAIAVAELKSELYFDWQRRFKQLQLRINALS